MTIIQKPVAATNYETGRRGFLPIAVVIHIEDGSEAGTDAWFNDPHSHVSSHYSIGKDGAVHQYVKEEDTSYANGTVVGPTWPPIMPGGSHQTFNPNRFTLSIEHEGKSGDGLTPEQFASSSWLVERLCDRWNLPLDDMHVIPHHAIRANKSCPGSGIDCERIIAGAIAVRSLRTPVSSQTPTQNA